jgi:hypothetical protein
MKKIIIKRISLTLAFITFIFWLIITLGQGCFGDRIYKARSKEKIISSSNKIPRYPIQYILLIKKLNSKKEWITSQSLLDSGSITYNINITKEIKEDFVLIASDYSLVPISESELYQPKVIIDMYIGTPTGKMAMLTNTCKEYIFIMNSELRKKLIDDKKKYYSHQHEYSITPEEKNVNRIRTFLIIATIIFGLVGIYDKDIFNEFFNSNK